MDNQTTPDSSVYISLLATRLVESNTKKSRLIFHFGLSLRQRDKTDKLVSYNGVNWLPPRTIVSLLPL